VLYTPEVGLAARLVYLSCRSCCVHIFFSIIIIMTSTRLCSTIFHSCTSLWQADKLLMTSPFGEMNLSVLFCTEGSIHACASQLATTSRTSRGISFPVIVIVLTNQDSTSSRLLPGSSYSCCIRNLHACTCAQTVPPRTHRDST
jgi:hypothetical protein